MTPCDPWLLSFGIATCLSLAGLAALALHDEQTRPRPRQPSRTPPAHPAKRHHEAPERKKHMGYPLVFIDCETLGLDHNRHPMWEIAAITRAPDGVDTEHLWQIRPTDEELAWAEPEALNINRYRDRMQVPPWTIVLDMLHPDGPTPIEPAELDTTLRRLLAGAALLGSNPDFDARFLRARLDGTPVWRRTIDVPLLAAGWLYGRAHAQSQTLSARTHSPYDHALELADGWKPRRLSAALGVEPPADGVAHTALGDTRWIRDLYDAITTPPASHPAGQPHSAARRNLLPTAGRRP